MGRVRAIAPAEARFGAVAMVCLALMALLVAGVSFSAGTTQLSALFLVLAIVGIWQAAFYWRH